MKQNKFKVVIPMYNSENWVQKCLLSLCDQSYQNWESIIINDNSTDGTLEEIKKFIKNISNNAKKKRFRVFDRNINKGALENIVYGTNIICEDDEDIIVLLDGDDWLASDDVLEHLNNLYQDDTWLTYGCFKYNSFDRISSHVQINDTRTYRTSQIFNTSHLRTYKYKIWKRIQDNDLRDTSGKYYSMAWDLAIMYPLIEMSGPHRIKCANKLMYIYNDLNPLNDHKKNGQLQVLMDQEIRRKLKYKELP